jgi:hypothetical protein
VPRYVSTLPDGAAVSASDLDVPSAVVDGWEQASLVLGNHPDSPTRLSSPGMLRGWEALVLRRQAIRRRSG